MLTLNRQEVQHYNLPWQNGPIKPGFTATIQSLLHEFKFFVP